MRGIELQGSTHTVGCHRRIVRSLEPDAICPVTLLKSTLYTLPCSIRAAAAQTYAKARAACLRGFAILKRCQRQEQGTGVAEMAACLVASEAVGAQLGLEVPDHDGAVVGGRGHLLQVGVECDSGDALLVPLEGALQLRVAHVCLVPILGLRLFVAEA